MRDYTLTTEEVRDYFALGMITGNPYDSDVPEKFDMFERWLNEHDAERAKDVQAMTLNQAATDATNSWSVTPKELPLEPGRAEISVWLRTRAQKVRDTK